MRARGSGPDFLFALADAGQSFLIDVHKSFVIYEVDPQPTIPGPSSKARKARELISGQVFIEQPKAFDLHAASKLDAEATLLGRKVL